MHQWIYVGESGSDVYTFWQTCEELGYDFVLRVAKARDVEVPKADASEALDAKHLKTLARALPAVDAHVVSIPAQHHQPKREVILRMNFQKVRVQPPRDASLLAQNGEHRLGRARLLNAPAARTRGERRGSC